MEDSDKLSLEQIRAFLEASQEVGFVASDRAEAIPLSTPTPKRAMKPIEADRFRSKFRNHKAAMPPTNATGTLRRMSALA
jgi:hypothetical protein